MNPPTCPICSKPLAADAPQGICPACLMHQAMRLGDAPAVPPAVELEQLAAAFPQLVVEELIGMGGMGRVYRAQQPQLSRTVALKVLSPGLVSDPEWIERFTREARALARLSHPNIVQVFEFGDQPMPFLLMEYVDGVNLRQAMEQGRLTASETLAIVPKLCDALQYAHEHGVLHRDIKPENILIDGEGRVKVVDFGLAKLRDESALQFTLTQTGAKLGTVAYMAPEQIEKPADVDHRADLYSLGVVLYEMLTGELPLGRFPTPSEAGGVDPRLDGVVMRTLEKKREKRFQNADEMRTGIADAANGKAPAVRVSWRWIAAACAIPLLIFFGWAMRPPAVEKVPPTPPPEGAAQVEARARREEAQKRLELTQPWITQVSRTDSTEARDAGIRSILDALSSTDPKLVLAGLSTIPRISQIHFDKTKAREEARKHLGSGDPKVRALAVTAVVTTSPAPADEERILALIPDAKNEELGALAGALDVFSKRDFTGRYAAPMLHLLERGLAVAIAQDGTFPKTVDERDVLGPLWGAKISPEIEARIIEWSRLGQTAEKPLTAANSVIAYNVFYYALSTQANKSAASVKRVLELVQNPDTGNIGGRCLWGLRGTVSAKEDQATVATGIIALLENRTDEYLWKRGLEVLQGYANKEHIPPLEKLAAREALPEENAKTLARLIDFLRKQP